MNATELWNFATHKQRFVPTDKPCPECGRPLEKMQILTKDGDWIGDCGYGSGVWVDVITTVECACIEERRQQAQSERIRCGRIIRRSCIRKSCNLRTQERAMLFETFKPTEKQQAAFDAAMRWKSDGSGRGLLLIGGVGCGKTHLAAAIANRIIDELPISDDAAESASWNVHQVISPRFLPLYFITEAELFGRLWDEYSQRCTAEQSVLDTCMNTPVLFLDDLGTTKPTEATMERFFRLIDHRTAERLPIIGTSNLTRQELQQKLGVRTTDRLFSICDIIASNEGSHRGKQPLDAAQQNLLQQRKREYDEALRTIESLRLE